MHQSTRMISLCFLLFLSLFPTSFCFGEMQEEELLYTDLEMPFEESVPGDYADSYCMPSACYGYFSASAEFLYWTLASGMREVSMSHKPTEATPTSSIFGDYKKQFISSHYEPGMRFGATYAPCCQDWTLAVLYTHFNPTYCNRFSPRTAETLFIPTQWPEVFFNSNATRSNSRFHLTYQTLDICFHYTPSSLDGCCRMCEPYIGVRLLDLKQHWKIRQRYTVASNADFTLLTQWKSTLPAIGLTLGLKGYYQLCGDFFLTGSLAASCVEGKVTNHSKYKIQNIVAPIKPYTLHSHSRDVFTGWEAQIGLAYLWVCENYTTCLSIGYEFQNWLNMPARIHDSFFFPSNSLASGLNFTLHGLFIKGSISF